MFEDKIQLYLELTYFSDNSSDVEFDWQLHVIVNKNNIYLLDFKICQDEYVTVGCILLYFVQAQLFA